RRPRFSFCIYNVKQLPEGPFSPRETAPTGGLARQFTIGLERISIDSTQTSIEQEKPAGQKCAPGLLINPKCERCVYGPPRLVSKDFLDKKSFFFIFLLTLLVVVCKAFDPLFAVAARRSPYLMPPSKRQAPVPLDIIGGLSAF
ncbi:MAG: hypothetical protein VYC90_02400, partial [Pseudomonadota bacterium]|nr:hypothetical protein [Pseudomonadota bacterium]